MITLTVKNAFLNVNVFISISYIFNGYRNIMMVKIIKYL